MVELREEDIVQLRKDLLPDDIIDSAECDGVDSSLVQGGVPPDGFQKIKRGESDHGSDESDHESDDEDSCFADPTPRAPMERNLLQFNPFAGTEGCPLSPKGRFKRCQSIPLPVGIEIHSFHVQSFASGSSFGTQGSVRDVRGRLSQMESLQGLHLGLEAMNLQVHDVHRMRRHKNLTIPSSPEEEQPPPSSIRSLKNIIKPPKRPGSRLTPPDMPTDPGLDGVGKKMPSRTGDSLRIDRDLKKLPGSGNSSLLLSASSIEESEEAIPGHHKRLKPASKAPTSGLSSVLKSAIPHHRRHASDGTDSHALHGKKSSSKIAPVRKGSGMREALKGIMPSGDHSHIPPSAQKVHLLCKASGHGPMDSPNGPPSLKLLPSRICSARILDPESGESLSPRVHAKRGAAVSLAPRRGSSFLNSKNKHNLHLDIGQRDAIDHVSRGSSISSGRSTAPTTPISRSTWTPSGKTQGCEDVDSVEILAVHSSKHDVTGKDHDVARRLILMQQHLDSLF